MLVTTKMGTTGNYSKLHTFRATPEVCSSHFGKFLFALNAKHQSSRS